MRIGLIINTIDTNGGIQKNYKLWFELLKSKGIETYLFVLKKPKLIEVKDKNIVFLDKKFIFLNGIELYKQIKSIGKFDLFLVNSEYMKKFLPKGLVSNYYITVHNSWAKKVINRGIKGFIRKIRLNAKYKNQKLIGISQSVLDDITKTLQIPVKERKVIYAPHNIKKVRELANEDISFSNYIVAVGALNKRKNYPLLLEAFSKLQFKNLKLLIIGEGPEREIIKKKINLLGIEKRVYILGFKENPYPYIKNAEALVLSSFSEGLPRVIVEALILHTPVISTNSSEGLKEIMINDLEQFISSFDTQELKEKIELALKRYPQIDKRLYQKFDIEYSFKKIMELI